MIRIREALPEDKEAWNEVASKSPSATYAHTWEWKEVVEEGLGLKSICLVAEDDGKIVGIYSGFLKPIANKPLMKGKYVLFSPLDLTWDYGGPCAIGENADETTTELIVQMEKFAKKNGAVSVRASPFVDAAIKRKFLDMGYRTSARLNSFIDLKIAEDKLESNVRKKWRQYVRKAETNGIQIRKINGNKELKSVYDAILSVHQRESAYFPPFSFFETLTKGFDENKLWIRAAIHNEKIIGGDILFKHRNMVVERYRGVLDEYADLRPYYLMMWSAIMESKKQGFETYDLGGMPPDEKSGIYFFKSGWGGKITNIDWYIKDLDMVMIRQLKRKVMGSR